MKKCTALVLALILALSCMPFAFAQQTNTRLYTVFADGMLFQQKDEAIVAGEAEAGSKITAKLTDENGDVIRTGESTASSDGTFEVSFIAPEGAFKEYTLTVSQNGQVIDTLERVAFGELWLASGQSNMQYPLGQAKGGLEDMMNGTKYSEWLRVLVVPAYRNNEPAPTYIPDEPMTDIVGAYWIDGQSDAVYGMSAVAFYFANEMLEELDMPVGILNSALGGSAIASWISREKIDATPEYKRMLEDYGIYKEHSEWNEKDQNVYTDIGANYNHKIEGLRFFRPVGMIWYQGESDIGYPAEYYSKSMDVMQELFTEVFDYDNGMLPLIYTNLAEYFYTEDGMVLPDRNIAFAEMQANRPESRATFGIYDLPITYLSAAGLIHPETKKEIGERMALCAKGMVYGKYDTFTAASVSSVQVKDSALYVTLKNTGDGLVCTGDRLYGFAVCGEDGIYIEAQAEIVSENTVKVWNESVKNPVSASYAYCMGNGRSNLAAAYEGEAPLPVNIFITDKTVGRHYWTDKRWADCENETVWHTISDSNSTFYSTWTGEDVKISFNGNDAYYGNKGMNVIAENDEFIIRPLLTFKDGKKVKNFPDTDENYSDYDTMTFRVRNNGENDITLDEVRFYKNNTMWHTPAVSGTTDTKAVIPADGEWHVITLDLNKLYLHGNEGGVGFTNKKLKTVRDIEFRFSGEDANLSFDEVSFTASDEKVKSHFDAEFKSADGFFETLCVIVTRFLGIFAKIFR